MTRTMPLIVLLAALGVSGNPLQAQGPARAPFIRHAVYVEAGGTTGVASINYDRLVGKQWAARIGIEPDGTGPHITEWSPEIPLTVSYLALGGHHRIEAGGGLVLTGGSRWGLDRTEHIGYRYQPTTSGLFLRATLVHRASEHYRLLPRLPFWGGLGLGYTF